MISHKHKFIFLFQTKCASSTVFDVLKKVDIDARNLSFHWGTKSPEYLNGELENYSDYFVFANIRNPYERAVSAWIYLQRDFECKRTFTKGLSLKETFKNLPQGHDKPYTAHDHRHITQQQVDSLLSKNGKFITDMLIRVENLQHDFNIVCDKIGIPQQQLPHLNKTKHKHYTEYYDDETRQIVAEKYAKDIEYFGYEFGE